MPFKYVWEIETYDVDKILKEYTIPPVSHELIDHNLWDIRLFYTIKQWYLNSYSFKWLTGVEKDMWSNAKEKNATIP